MPEWGALADLQFYTATGESRPVAPSAQPTGHLAEWYAGESRDYHVWLVYRPDPGFMRSRESALTQTLASAIVLAFGDGKRHMVFAPARYVPNKDLLPMGVEYAPLPYSLFRVEKA